MLGYRSIFHSISSIFCFMSYIIRQKSDRHTRKNKEEEEEEEKLSTHTHTQAYKEKNSGRAFTRSSIRFIDGKKETSDCTFEQK